MSFAGDLQKWADSAKVKIEDVVHKTAELALEGCVLRSPVGDPPSWASPPPPGYIPGEFKANWNVGVGEIDATVTNTKDTNGGATIARGRARIDASDAFGGYPVFITNSKAYARRLEYEGWSKQAPAGMVRITIALLGPQVEAYIASIR